MFVILGATGKVGRTTIAGLRQKGVAVRAVVRDAAKAGQLASLGCEIAVTDLWDVTALTRALEGASAVQVICPVSPQGVDAAADMRRSIANVGEALEAAKAPAVLAISDYGADISAGTGITVLFHELEARLRRLPSRLILLRSAERMQNWARVTQVAAATGVLPSLHHPLTKLFPTVSAYDVGAVATDLLLAPASAPVNRASSMWRGRGDTRRSTSRIRSVFYLAATSRPMPCREANGTRPCAKVA